VTKSLLDRQLPTSVAPPHWSGPPRRVLSSVFLSSFRGVDREPEEYLSSLIGYISSIFFSPGLFSNVLFYAEASSLQRIFRGLTSLPEVLFLFRPFIAPIPLFLNLMFFRSVFFLKKHPGSRLTNFRPPFCSAITVGDELFFPRVFFPAPPAISF